MFSQTIGEVRATAASGEKSDRFHASLSDGLHALAQPLTILRSSITAASAEGITPSRQKHYLDISKSQVERACELFGSLQELAIAGWGLASERPVDAIEKGETP
jgi:hypothetical protein